jgi:hypothetical protein
VFLLGYPPSGGGVTPDAFGAKPVKQASEIPTTARQLARHFLIIVFIGVFLFGSADDRRSTFNTQRSTSNAE